MQIEHYHKKILFSRIYYYCYVDNSSICTLSILLNIQIYILYTYIVICYGGWWKLANSVNLTKWFNNTTNAVNIHVLNMNLNLSSVIDII